MDRIKWCSMISGGGTTMEAMLKEIQSGRLYKFTPALIIASSDDAGGIEKARAMGVSRDNIVVIHSRDFDSAKAFGEALLLALRQHEIEVITQNGWMLKTPSNAIDAFLGKIFNQHPGPTPDFGGKGMFGRRVHCARLLFARMTGRASWTEAVAQRVAYQYDEGAIVKSRIVGIHKGDTVEELQARVLPTEHEVQILMLEDFGNNNLKEITREHPLVLPEEEPVLAEAKRIACLLYPNG
jgi:phosphoribosylglycinamide formyltransferase 1